jgi:hypothetical protein
VSADIEIVLDECLAQVDRGASLEASLGDHAALAPELRPLLALAADLRAMPPPRASTQAVADGKQRMLAAFAAQNRAQPAAKPILVGLADQIRTFLRLGQNTDAKRFMPFAVATLLVLVLGTTGALAAASTSSLPGDALYPVKQSVEGLRLAFTFDGQARQDLAGELNAERLQEIQRLLALRRQGIVEFDGLLQAQAGNQWIVSGLALHLGDGTVIEGWPAVGMRIWVRVQVGSDGTLTATRVRLAGSGAEAPGGAFVSPLASPTPVPTATPTATQSPTPQPGSWVPNSPMPTHRPAYGPWAGDWQTHEPTPAGWPSHDGPGTWETDHAEATPGATHDATSAKHANPTAWPTRSTMLTRQPQHESPPTEPARQWLPTSQPPHHDGGSTPPPPPHQDYQQGGGDSDSGRRH